VDVFSNQQIHLMKSLMELELLSWDVQIPAKFGVSSFTRKTQLHTMLMHHRRV
jgi:hypothetical protein